MRPLMSDKEIVAILLNGLDETAQREPVRWPAARWNPAARRHRFRCAHKPAQDHAA